MGFSKDFFVTTDVMAEKRSHTQGNLHQWFRIHRPTGITHIPRISNILTTDGADDSNLFYLEKRFNTSVTNATFLLL